MMLTRHAQGLARPSMARAPVAPRMIVSRAAAAEVKTSKDKAADVVKEEDVPDVQVSTQEVQKFLNTLVSETNIAELHLQVGNFELKVRRSLAAGTAAGGVSGHVHHAAPAPAPAAPAYTAPSSTLVITKAPPPTMMTLEESMDESLVTVISPKVGIFRRGKYAAGKRVGKGNAVNVGDQVKKGQVLGHVEQLGTFVPVEAPQAGEVVKFLVDEGLPVEYRQDVVELAPFFAREAPNSSN